MVIDTTLTSRFLLIQSVILVYYVFLNKKVNYVYTPFLSVFMLYVLASFLWASNYSLAIFKSTPIVLSFFVVQIFSNEYVINKKLENTVSRYISIVVLLCILVALTQFFAIEIYNPYQIKSLFGHKNLFSSFLLLSLPFVIIGIKDSLRFFKILNIFLIIVVFYFVIILQTRSVYLGLLSSSIIFLVIGLKHKKRLINKKTIIYSAIFIACVTILFSIFYSNLDSKRKDFLLHRIDFFEFFYEPKVKNDVQIKKADENIDTRLVFWKRSLLMIKDYPIFGVGQGNWDIEVNNYPNPPLPNHTKENLAFNSPHNTFLSIVTELGIIGFILFFIVFLLPIFVTIYQIFFQNLFDKKLFVYISFYSGFFVYSFFDFSLCRPMHIVILSIILVLIQHRTFTVQVFEVKYMKLFYSLYIILIGLYIIIALSQIKGEYYSKIIYNSLHLQDEATFKLWSKSENFIYKQTPNLFPISFYKSALYRKHKNYPKALFEIEKALALNPYEVRVLNDYAIILMHSNKQDLAKQTYEKIIQLNPFYEDAIYNLAALYYFEKNTQKAQELLLRIPLSTKKENFEKNIKLSIENR